MIYILACILTTFWEQAQEIQLCSQDRFLRMGLGMRTRCSSNQLCFKLSLPTVQDKV